LAECQTCRDWQRQLLQIEHNVGRLPAPASSPQAFLDKFLGWPAASTTEHPGSLSSNGGASSPATPDTAHAAVDGSSLTGPAADRKVFPTLSFARRPWTVRRWVGMVGAGLAAAVVLIGGGILLGNLLSDLLKKNQEIAHQKDKQPPDPEKDQPGPDKKPEDKKPDKEQDKTPPKRP